MLAVQSPGNAAEKGKPGAWGKDWRMSPEYRQSLTNRTLGGRQFWGDVHFFHEYRIQQNVLTRHYRLLDGKDYRLETGSLEDCLRRLARVRRERSLPPMKGKAVIVIHGIIRSSKSFASMSERLRKEGYSVFGFDYPSTRVEIPESASFLAQAIESLDGVEEINFVVHSMGGLVVRSYLSNGKRDRRIKRMVMLGVPNLGAHMADKVRKNLVYKLVFGPAGQQLVTDNNGLIAKLAIPDFEFAVIAGCKGTTSGYNPLIPGDDDGTVSVSSTRLPGAADFTTVKVLHSFMNGNTEVIECSVRFLKEGRLRAEGDPRPIPRMNPSESPAATGTAE